MLSHERLSSQPAVHTPNKAVCVLREVSVCFGENFQSLLPQLDLGTFAKAQQASTGIVLLLFNPLRLLFASAGMKPCLQMTQK